MSKSHSTERHDHSTDWARSVRPAGKIEVSHLPLSQVVSLAKETSESSELSIERRGGNSYLVSRT